MMRCVFICASLFVSLSFVCVPIKAEKLNFITIEVAPWAYRDREKGAYAGIFPELINEIEARTDYDISITLTPYARIDRELESRRQDCTMLVRSSFRDKFTELGELIFDHSMGVIPRKGISLESYNDLQGVSISVLRALSITSQFNNDSRLNKQMDTSYEMGLRKMSHGRLDAIAGAIPTIQYLAKVNGMSELLGEPLELSVEPIYLQCARGSKTIEHLKKLNMAIRSVKSEMILEKILNDNK